MNSESQLELARETEIIKLKCALLEGKSKWHTTPVSELTNGYFGREVRTSPANGSDDDEQTMGVVLQECKFKKKVTAIIIPTPRIRIERKEIKVTQAWLTLSIATHEALSSRGEEDDRRSWIEGHMKHLKEIYERKGRLGDLLYKQQVDLHHQELDEARQKYYKEGRGRWRL